MSIISVIYHIKKIIIPLEKRTDFEMTLEIIIIIISKRKSYLILAEGQHDGQAQRIPGVCSKPRTTRTQYHIPIQWIGPPLNSGTARIFITD